MYYLNTYSISGGVATFHQSVFSGNVTTLEFNLVTLTNNSQFLVAQANINSLFLYEMNTTSNQYVSNVVIPANSVGKKLTLTNNAS